MSATQATKREAIELLAGLRHLPADKYAWGRRMRLNPSETDQVWRAGLHKRNSNPSAST